MSLLAVLFLKLYLCTRILVPKSIPQKLLSLVSAVRRDEKHRLIAWEYVDGEVFAEFFKGRTFVDLLQECQLYSDPTNLLLETLLLLRDVVQELANDSAA